MRPKSFIVIPELSPVRKELLKTYNITWIPHQWDEFTELFLQPLQNESKAGFMKIKQMTKESITKNYSNSFKFNYST